MFENPITTKKAFPRVLLQLGYTWDFTPSNLLKVTIPTLSSHAFDRLREKVLPWELQRMVDACEADMFWPCVTDENYHDFTEFIVHVKIEVNQNFFKVTAPKYPLQVIAFTSYLGNTSRCIRHEVRHVDSTEIYFTVENIYVFVNKRTRKPAAYPSWMRETFSVPSTKETERKPRQVAKATGDAFATDFKVCFSDTDSNNHTNFTTYVRFAYDALLQNITDKKYPKETSQLVQNGLKSMEIRYKAETLLGDSLTVVSWLDQTQNDTVQFDIKSTGRTCCEITMQFFRDAIKYDVSKL